jgi:Mn2+/Fe2+ NRAMP family transporter
MNIHPLWFLCIFVRIALVFLTIFIKRNYVIFKKYLAIIILLLGIGFIYKAMFGSNNETQFVKVFWHETRYLHGVLYIISSIYIYKNNLDMGSLILLIDLLFSVLYRVLLNK